MRLNWIELEERELVHLAWLLLTFVVPFLRMRMRLKVDFEFVQVSLNQITTVSTESAGGLETTVGMR